MAATIADHGEAAAGYQAMAAALEVTRRFGGPVAVAEALRLAHRRLTAAGPDGLRHRIAQDLIAESRRTGRHSDALAGLLGRCVDLILDGDVRAPRYLTELRSLLRRQDDSAVGYVVQAIEVMFDVRAGRLDRAEQRARRCAASGAAAGHAAAARWHCSHLIAIRWYQGRIAELLPLLRNLAPTAGTERGDDTYLSALAVAAAAAGARDEAAAALAALTDGGPPGATRSPGALVTLYGIVEAAHLLGAADVAAAAYERLRPHAGRPIVAVPAIACFGSVQHALGVARLTTGEFGAAAEHLRAAVHDNLALGHWPAVALARHRLALALAGTGGPERRGPARREAEQARREALDLGMRLPGGPPPGGDRRRRAAGGAAPEVGCRRQGRRWRVEAAGRVVIVGHSRGMARLAVLLANPGREISAVHLDDEPPSRLRGDDDGGPAGRQALDGATIERYRERLRRLRDDIDRCDRTGDQAGAIRAHAERDEILARLRSAAGAAEPAQPSTAERERARIAVGKSIRRAVHRITAADPAVGAVLSAGLQTGHHCVYRPVEPPA